MPEAHYGVKRFIEVDARKFRPYTHRTPTMNVETQAAPAQIVREKLAQYLGPFTAKNAVQMMSRQSAAVDADRLTKNQIPALLEALGPTLRTLLGRATAEKVTAEIRKELAL
jgi:hypothetical protein